MRKTYALTHPKTKTARLVDSIKHDIKKYLGRERRKKLPEGTDYWTFDCQFGASQDSAEDVYVSELTKRIDGAVERDLPEVYVVILARAAVYDARPEASEDQSDSED